MIYGTLGYMAPELFENPGESKHSHKQDIFSLGATLYDLIAGEQLIKGHTTPDLAK